MPRHTCDATEALPALRTQIEDLKARLGLLPAEEDLRNLSTLLTNIAVDFESLLGSEDLGCGSTLRSHPNWAVEYADKSLAKLQGIVAGLKYKEQR